VTFFGWWGEILELLIHGTKFLVAVCFWI